MCVYWRGAEIYCQPTSGYHQYQIGLKDLSEFIVSYQIAFSLAINCLDRKHNILDF